MEPSAHRTLIIAEAGVNHNGNPDLAFKLVDAARAAGADVVKFQAFKAEAVISARAPKAGYQMRTTDPAESQLDMARRLELAPEVFRELAAHCRKLGLVFLATPFDLGSIDLLAGLKLELVKIPSGEITNLPYLRKIGALDWEIILSTGLSTLDEVGEALGILEAAGAPRARITLLHCTTEYPAPFAEANLRAMDTMRQAFPGLKGVGYSDHTPGIAVSVAAAALGATVIEKHFTLDKNMEGPDHKASLEPPELAALARSIREVEAALGDGLKAPSASEIKNLPIVRKSLVASRAIKAGETFTEDNLTVKRPGTGLSPRLWDSVLGSCARRDYAPDEVLD